MARTPGDWTYLPMSRCVISKHDGMPITVCTLEYITEVKTGPREIDAEIRFSRLEEVAANGRLIAAAPKLLEALRLFMAIADEDVTHDAADEDRMCKECIRFAKLALREAGVTP